MGLRIAVVAHLSDEKLASKLRGLLSMPEIEELSVVRRRPLELAGVRNLCPPAPLRGAPPLAEAWRLGALLQSCLARPRPSALVAFYFRPHVAYAELARRLTGVPTVPVAISSEDVDRAVSSRFFRGAVRAAHAVGVRGAGSRGRLAAAGVDPARLFVPPNTFDAGPFTPAPGVEPEHDLLFVGGLERVKRLDWLLEAVARVAPTRPDLRVTLVGDGPERGSLQAQAGRLGLAPRVRFLGQRAPVEVAALLQRSRAFVLTSRYEGLPMALLEAFCCGVPAVVPEVGDVAELAEDGRNALLVRDPSVAGFAEAFERLLGDDRLHARLASGALRTRERILRESSVEASAAAWRAALAGL